MPDASPTFNRVNELREAEKTFTDFAKAGLNGREDFSAKRLNRAKLVRAESFSALIEIAEAASLMADDCGCHLCLIQHKRLNDALDLLGGSNG